MEVTPADIIKSWQKFKDLEIKWWDTIAEKVQGSIHESLRIDSLLFYGIIKY